MMSLTRKTLVLVLLVSLLAMPISPFSVCSPLSLGTWVLNAEDSGRFPVRTVKVDRLGSLPSVVPAVSTSYDHTVGLKSDGTVVAVGDNSDGQCNVSSWTGIIQVAAGGYHTVGLKSDGTVVAVGANSVGQCNVSSWTGIKQIAAGRVHTVGLKSDGTVVAVGNDSAGRCDVGAWSGIQQVAAGGSHTVGLKSDGTVVAVGYNSDGQCDVISWAGVQQVAAGNEHTVGLKLDGTVVAVGRNDLYGQCNVTSWTGITRVAAGWLHTVGLKSDGSVVAVGWDAYDQCKLGSWTEVRQVSAGQCHTVGLKSDGTVVASGVNWSGQCNVDDWHLLVPTQPVNVLPADGATGIGLTPTLTCSAFSNTATDGTHAASQWQMRSASSAYASPLYDSNIDGSHLTQITLPSGILTGNATYHWRVRHQDSHGAWSAWSPETSFTATARAPNQPSNIVPPTDAAGASLTPTLQCSAFTDPDSGDTHSASQWQVRTTSGDYLSPIYDSGTDNANLTITTIPSGLLSHSTAYCWHIRHQDSTGLWSDWSAETFFTTTAKGGLPFWIWIIVGVAAVLIVGAVAYLLGRRRKPEQRATRTTRNESQTGEAQKETSPVLDSSNAQSKSMSRKGVQWKVVVGWILFAWGLLGLLGNIVFILVWDFAPLSLVVNSIVCILFIWGGWRLSHPTANS